MRDLTYQESQEQMRQTFINCVIALVVGLAIFSFSALITYWQSWDCFLIGAAMGCIPALISRS